MTLSPPIETRTDPASLEHYGRDWTRFWSPAPEAVVFPRSTEEVVELVHWARQEKKALVPSGGRTGLSGGAVAAHGETVVSLEKMRDLIEADPAEPSLTVQAGMTIGEVQRLAVENGGYYPIDWAAAGSSQVGGSIATNAGGIRVLRYGMTREWVRGLTVVTGAGEVLKLNRGLVKNNAGLDLRHLLIGSEGTLGIITEATLGLTRPPMEQSVLLLGLASLDALMPTFARLRQTLALSAFEFFDANSVRHVARASGSSFPISDDCPFHALIEFDDPNGSCQDKALEIFESLVDEGLVSDGTISQSGAQVAELWHWREAISESIASCTPYKNDLSVRTGRVPAFLRDLDELVGSHYPDFEVVWFGHIGDGNLHMNVLKPGDWSLDDFHHAGRHLSPAVFRLVQKHEGSISAEHGVGLLKCQDLRWTRTESEIHLMEQIRRTFDPDGILNPGKMLPAET